MEVVCHLQKTLQKKPSWLPAGGSCPGPITPRPMAPTPSRPAIPDWAKLGQRGRRGLDQEPAPNSDYRDRTVWKGRTATSLMPPTWLHLGLHRDLDSCLHLPWRLRRGLGLARPTRRPCARPALFRRGGFYFWGKETDISKNCYGHLHGVPAGLRGQGGNMAPQGTTCPCKMGGDASWRPRDLQGIFLNTMWHMNRWNRSA